MTKVLGIIFFNAAGIYLISLFLPGVTFNNFWSSLFTTILISFLNAVIYPFFNRYLLPLTVLSLGLIGLILNGILVMLADFLLPGLEISSFGSAIWFIFWITIINTIFSNLFNIDNDEIYFRNVIKKQAKKPLQDSKTPGFIFLQIDGLSYEVLKRALQSGNAPHLSNWIREGKYRLEKWETDWSSQTGASQAGILMGSNKNIPAFRWFDKSTQKTFSFSLPRNLRELERKLTGDGLLQKNGASRGNLFSGDAEYVLLTVSSIGKRDTDGIGHGYFAYFANPYNLPRTIIFYILDIFREIRSQVDQNRRNVWPRLTHKKFSYPLLRAFTTVIQRDIIFQTIIGDVFEGRDSIYADIVGYDEVAHHTGPERHESMGILRDIDRQIRRLEMAISESKRKYQIVLLSDHGQSQGATFKEISGEGLDDYVKKLLGGAQVNSQMESSEDSNVLKTAVLEVTKTGGLIASGAKRIPKVSENGNGDFKKEDIQILASGCLGLIYFTKYKKRLTLEGIEKNFPGLIDGLISHPLIGFILMDSKEGGVVLGAEGKYFLKSGKIIGKNPLEGFGENAINHIKRTHSFSNVADIMVNSSFDPVLNEVHSFEELVGSHGGLGGDQSFPFLLFPSQFSFPKTPIIGAENIHLLFKKWLLNLKG